MNAATLKNLFPITDYYFEQAPYAATLQNLSISRIPLYLYRESYEDRAANKKASLNHRRRKEGVGPYTCNNRIWLL